MELKRRTQISESHCGPAVVEMLLAHLGIEKTQEEITKASGAVVTIDKDGTRVDQLARAVNILAPQVVLYYKSYASFSNIETLLSEYNLPVGVEWQGLFYENEEEEEKGMDYGHYSVVTYISEDRKELIMVDPYKDFVNSDRIINVYKFLNRWWDKNDVKDRRTGKKSKVKDYKLLFVISPRNPEMVEILKLKSFY